LLGQVLAASTYPLEIVEAGRWLQQNGNLRGQQLIDAAKQQNWDPSVQALVAFPDALNLLDKNIQWTTDLGNAFLSQQSDVMSAIQRMRARASANGKLTSTPQQVVTSDTQNGQSAIQIQPADPQVIYVPVYQPYYVWGPPVWGAYPPLWYPPGFGFGFGFGPGIYIGAFFPGWLGWGGWGWGCGWFGGGLFVNGAFFGHYGYHGYGYGGYWRGGYGYAGRSAWVHDPGHRIGVAYPNQTVASRFNSNRFAGSSRLNGAAANTRNFNSFNRAGTTNNFNRSGTNNGFAGSYRQGSPNYSGRSATEGRAFNAAPAYRGGASSYGRSFAPAYSGSARSYAAPRSYSAPGSYSAPRQSFNAPRSSASHFSGGGSHFSGGGHSGGGGHGGGGGHHR
jgi:hypothetical protein